MDDLQALVGAHVAGWNAKDLGAIMATYTPDIVFPNHTAGEAAVWDGVDVFPLRDGLIARKDVYSTSHIARLRP